MGDLLAMLNDLPAGFPQAVALNIWSAGLSADETRGIFTDDYPEAVVDQWLIELRAKGWFADETDGSSLTAAFDRLNADETSTEKIDGAKVLWETLLDELARDENDFKHRVAVMDSVLKQGGDIDWLAGSEAESIIPFDQIEDKYPWQGCKGVASAVMLFVSKPESIHKREAIQPVSRSLGGLRIPNKDKLNIIRDPNILSKELIKAIDKAGRGACVALLVNTTDVEIMRNPGKGKGVFIKSRPGTFAHCFVLAVSSGGVYVLQGYGPLGYTIYQHMQAHSSNYPLSFEDAKQWVKTFEVYSADRGGVWNEKVNKAYSHCFGVDLVKLGCMRIGSQLDAYTTVYSVEFDAITVKKNFALLPSQRRPSRPKLPPCRDGTAAKAKKPPPNYSPDGGVKHYYIPTVLRCGHCGKVQVAGKSHKRCIRCKAIHYCEKACQRADWGVHKAACKAIASCAKQN